LKNFYSPQQKKRTSTFPQINLQSEGDTKTPMPVAIKGIDLTRRKYEERIFQKQENKLRGKFQIYHDEINRTSI
jgi:hypothetical protein